METKIIRTKTVNAITSRLILHGCDTDKMAESVSKLGKERILTEIFEETDIPYNRLCQEYDTVINGGESEHFKKIYQINENYGVSLGANIYLYHGSAEILRQTYSIFGWGYMDTEKYLGDTWYYTDEEILSDIVNLPMLRFIDKYKGYIG